MRTLLAYAPHRDTFGYSMPPPGLLRLGGELERRGVAVALEDLAYRLAAGELGEDPIEGGAAWLDRRGAYDVLGLSVMGATLPAALALAERMKARRPGLRVVLGGPGTTGIDAALVERFAQVDAVVRGEAERTLPELLARWARGADLDGVDGVTWRDADGAVRREARRAQLADLGELAPYAWHLLPPLADYKRITGESEGLVPLDSGRGCVYDCSFCTIGRFWERRSRVLPAARLVDEVLALDALDGARNAYLCHDLFGAQREEALAFCAELARRGPRPWECRARVDHLDDALLDAMAAAGCYRVLLGVESAAAEVLARCDKRLRPDADVLRVVRACAARGITPILSLILGLPGEGPDELEASLALCLRASLAAGVNLSLHLPNPQPGCGLGEEHGAASRPVEGIPPDMAFGAGETAVERALVAAHPDLFSTFALLPLPEDELRALNELARELPPVLQRYPRTWALLARARGLANAALFRAWRASGLSFEGFAQRAGDDATHDALRWEQALVRVAARGPLERARRTARSCCACAPSASRCATTSSPPRPRSPTDARPTSRRGRRASSCTPARAGSSPRA
ncbi:MAG: B12-binding domain-containing radical SAM protein [Planctomycetes bacterium]|nr:B12-binding domain-containing radical SAM protein [Planctomycetota bacterium]